jgi:hypothetical protein
MAYGAVTCATAYTHYTAVLLLLIQLGWALWTHPRARRALITANVVAALGFIPWINGFREDLHAPAYLGAFAPFNLHDIWSILESDWIVPGTLTVGLVCAGFTIGLLGLGLKARRTTSRWQPPPGIVFVTLLAFGPTVLLLLYSWLRVDSFGNPFLIYSWPALALVIGALVTSPPRPLWMAAVALTVGAYAIGGARTLSSAGQSPDIDAVVAYIDGVGSSGDVIVCQCLDADPLSELDVALADSGSSQGYAVLRLGVPSKAASIATLSGPNPQPQAPGRLLPIAPPQAVAKQAVALSHDGTIFLVTYALRGFGNNSESTAFLKDLPSSFHIVEHMTYPGLSGAYLQSVFVIRDTESNR